MRRRPRRRLEQISATTRADMTWSHALTKMSQWRMNGREAMVAWRDVHLPVAEHLGPIIVLYYYLLTVPMAPAQREGPLACGVGNASRMTPAHMTERPISCHGSSVVRPKRVVLLGPLGPAPGLPLAAPMTVLKVVTILGVLPERVA